MLASVMAFAQQTVVKGKITDIETGETLPMATVSYVCEGETFGTTSDMNGVYRLESDKIFDYVVFQFAGYKPYKVKIKRFTTQTINAKMESEMITLPKAEVRAKRKIKERYKRKGNPAVELIRKVQKNAERNSLTGFDYYQYDEYSKLELGPSNLSDSLQNLWIMRNVQFVYDNMRPSELTGRNYLSMYFVETLSKTYYRKDPYFKTTEVSDSKDVLFSKFMDFSNMEAVIDNWIGFVDVYQRNVNLFNNEYTSPMSPIAVTFYHFYIVDTVQYENENCIVLAFTPSNQMDMGLCGSLWITNDSSYMVKKVQLQIPKHSGTNFVEAMMFEQEYKKVDNVMIPTRYSLVADIFYLGVALHGKRSGVFSNIEINKPMPENFYTHRPEKTRSKGFYDHHDDENYWKERRTDSLSYHEKRIAEDKAECYLKIEDQGLGMSKEDLKYLFNTGSSYMNKSKREIIEKMEDYMRPSGIFGIGFQSVFLIADSMEPLASPTKIFLYKLSENPVQLPRTLVSVKEKMAIMAMGV